MYIRSHISWNKKNIYKTSYWPHTARQGPQFPPNWRPNSHIVLGMDLLSLSHATNVSIRFGAVCSVLLGPSHGETATSSWGKCHPATAQLEALQSAVRAPRGWFSCLSSRITRLCSQAQAKTQSSRSRRLGPYSSIFQEIILNHSSVSFMASEILNLSNSIKMLPMCPRLIVKMLLLRLSSWRRLHLVSSHWFLCSPQNEGVFLISPWWSTPERSWNFLARSRFSSRWLWYSPFTKLVFAPQCFSSSPHWGRVWTLYRSTQSRTPR